MTTPRRALTLLPGRYAVCRFAPEAVIPAWVMHSEATLWSLTRTPTELSAVCDEDSLPPSVEKVEKGWRALQVAGPIPFDETGVIAGITATLSAAGVPVFVVSTFDTDYVLVPDRKLADAGLALKTNGFKLG